jgi:hypothetical protein
LVGKPPKPHKVLSRFIRFFGTVLYLYKLIKNEIIDMDDNNGYFMRNVDETGEETWQQLII